MADLQAYIKRLKKAKLDYNILVEDDLILVEVPRGNTGFVSVLCFNLETQELSEIQPWE